MKAKVDRSKMEKGLYYAGKYKQKILPAILKIFSEI